MEETPTSLILEPAALHLDIPLYDKKLIISFNQDSETVKALLMELDPTATDIFYHVDNHTSYGCMYTTPTNKYFIRLNDFERTPDCLGALAHETFHATVSILRRVGMSLTEESEEAYAYLNDFITRKTMEFLPTLGYASNRLNNQATDARP